VINIKKIIRFSLKILIILLVAGTLTLSSLYLYAYLSPKISIRTNGKFFIYDADNNLVYQGSSSSEWVDIEDINDNIKNAIVSIEDKKFYKHEGFDYIRIAGALLNNMRSGYIVEGASTISQQYVKNMYLTFDKTLKRKIEEALLTLKLEVHYTKDEILEGYLNTINFGQGNYGIQDAARYYFNKDAKDINLEEACILAAIPKGPAYYNPVSDYEASIRRAKLVASTMVENGYIEEETKNSMYKEPVEIYGKRDKNNLQTLMYYQDAVLKELQNITSVPNSLIDAGGLKIYTALDLDIQTNLENAIKNNMKNDNMQVAAVYIDPHNGEIKALVGGKNYIFSQFNRATESKRQVGSTIKPFLYYAALSNGLTSASTFTSERTTFYLSNNNSYTPSNYNNIYGNKSITMAAALAYSDNVYAVKTHLFLGENTLVDTMKLMGIREKLLAVPSLALGTCDINMLDYAKAYLSLASGGYSLTPHLINKVEDMNGNVLYERKDEKLLTLNYNYVYILNEMLSNAYNTEFIDYNTPTAITLKGYLSRKYAIKTGTTDNDHWTIGFNPDALTLVWTGTDHNTGTNSGYSKITKNIWAETMETSLKDTENSWYETPPNVIGMPLNPINGEFTATGKNAIYYFIKGSEPEYYLSPTN